MTTDELIRDIAKRSGMNLREVRQTLNELTETIVEAVAAGETVKIEGLGAFYAQERAAKLARNWSTGEPLLVPACRVPAFKAWKQFKEAVKEKEKKRDVRQSGGRPLFVFQGHIEENEPVEWDSTQTEGSL